MGVNRVLPRDDIMSVSRRIGEENLGRQIETVQSGGSVEGAAVARTAAFAVRVSSEVRLHQLRTPRKQVRGDEEISGKRTPQL